MVDLPYPMTQNGNANSSHSHTLVNFMSQGRNPRITVVMPVRNGEKFIAESINSILAQTYENFRFLIVDDNSTDRTKCVVQEIFDHRIELVSNEYTPGRSGALNFAYELSDSEYIANMDADDTAMPDRFERQIHFMDNNPYIGVLGTYYSQVFENEPMSPKLRKSPLSDIGCKEQLLAGETCFGHPTTLIRKSSIPKNLKYRPQYWCTEDYKYYSEISMHTKLANIPYIGLNWRIHEKNISVLYFGEQRKQNKRIQLELFESLLTTSASLPPIQDEIETLQSMVYQSSYIELSKLCKIYRKLYNSGYNVNWSEHKKQLIINTTKRKKLIFSIDKNIDIRSYAIFALYFFKYNVLKKLSR